MAAETPDDSNRFIDGEIELVEPNKVRKQYDDDDFKDDETEDNEPA